MQISVSYTHLDVYKRQTFFAAEIREEMASFLALSLAFIAAIISLLKVSNSMVLFLLY